MCPHLEPWSVVTTSRRIRSGGSTSSLVLLLAAMALGCSAGKPAEGGDQLGLGTDGTGDEHGDFDDDDDTGGPQLPPIPEPTDGDDCDIGELGCPCTAGGNCNIGSFCVEDMCVPVNEDCGNGEIEDGEECDDGPYNADDAACTSNCMLQYCGDGFVGPGEACDDGNADEDECTSECRLPTCGNGQVDADEECDDDNSNDNDACLSTCLAATCGDGVVQDGVEDCDDGNNDDDDGCTQTCACQLTFEDQIHIDGWTLEGGWGLYSAAPLSSLNEVPFDSQGNVFGTDGNRVMPYPEGELESSSATTSSFLIPQALSFRSWHVDEGGLTQEDGNAYDTKRILISTDGGSSWDALVDCATGVNADLPFCQLQNQSRSEDDWDQVEIDLSEYAGETGQLRFEYDSFDSCCAFEQGWFIDELNALDCA